MFSFTYLIIWFVACSLVIYNVMSCPTTWIEYEDECYHFSYDQKSWSDAVEMCLLLGGGLVEIDDEDEQTFLQKKTADIGRMYWIGLNDIDNEGQWTWNYTDSALNETSYTNWRPKNPDNFTSLDDCTLMFPSGQWVDIVCTFVSYYICELDIIEVSVFG
ncbi:hypothetical protein ACF0H5_022201 [Mactra antiquata]